MSHSMLVALDCKKHSLHVQVSFAFTAEAPGAEPQPVKPERPVAGAGFLAGTFAIELVKTSSCTLDGSPKL